MRAASLAGARTYAAPVRPFACARRPGRATGASEATAGTGGPGARPCGPDDVRRALPCRPAGLRSISVCPGASRAPTKSWDAMPCQQHKARSSRSKCGYHVGRVRGGSGTESRQQMRPHSKKPCHAAAAGLDVPRIMAEGFLPLATQAKQERSGAGRTCQMQAALYYSYLALVPSRCTGV